MAKKKESISLEARNIEFMIQNIPYKALLFHPSNMSVDIQCLDTKEIGLKNIVFAHLPKEVKKLIKPT